jgi:hypothetical protein
MKLTDIHLLLLSYLSQTTEISFTKLYAHFRNTMHHSNYRRETLQQILRRLNEKTDYIEKRYTNTIPRELIVKISSQGKDVLEKFKHDFLSVPA